jgi:hypothetical protein
MGVCRFNGAELNCDCPLDNNMAVNLSTMDKIGSPIDFEHNSYWNSKSDRNLQSMDNYSSQGLRRINGPLRVNGDLLVEGDILGKQGAKFLNDILDNTGLSVTDLQTDLRRDLRRENDILKLRLDTAEKVIRYFCQRFVVNIEDIDKETEKLTERNHIDKRLDAIE